MDLDKYSDIQPFVQKEIRDALDKEQTSNAFDMNIAPQHAHTGSDQPKIERYNIHNYGVPQSSVVTTGGTTYSPDTKIELHVITTQGSALTIANPQGTCAQGAKILFRIKDDATPRALTWGAQYRATTIALPTTTTASKCLYAGFIYNAEDAKWDLIASVVTV